MLTGGESILDREGGYSIERQGFELTFNDPRGRPIAVTNDDLQAGDVATLFKNVPAGTDFDANSLTPACDSKRPDYQHIAWVLGQFVDSGDT